ncbi:helix-turn-helix domain-containing protein [Sagittula sp. MA-2]|uniref:helix-turn-helix domain-containing protein n=1 Tax=Sagittula sp. MA-2 TaxID=3048007 RepID=UPI00358ED9EA
MTAPRPYTPDTLAEKWACSAETIRQMCKRGDLHYFRVGRSYRIPAAAVEEHECPTSALDDCAEDSASTGPEPMESGGGIVLRHARERKLKPRQ